MSKQELARRIVRDMGYDYQTVRNIIDGIAFEGWLHDPDQVPGRTITESEISKAFGPEYVAWARMCLARIGITVVPDPEPTNAERLEAALLEAWDGHRSMSDVADLLDLKGVTAPEESK